METNYDGKASPEVAKVLMDDDVFATIRGEVEERMGKKLIFLSAQVSIYHSNLLKQGVSDFEAMELTKAFQEQLLRIGG